MIYKINIIVLVFSFLFILGCSDSDSNFQKQTEAKPVDAKDQDISCLSQLSNFHLGYEDQRKLHFLVSKSKQDYWNKEYLVAIFKEESCWVSVNNKILKIPFVNSEAKDSTMHLFFDDGANFISIEYWSEEKYLKDALIGGGNLISRIGGRSDTCKYNNIYWVNRYFPKTNILLEYKKSNLSLQDFLDSIPKKKNIEFLKEVCIRANEIAYINLLKGNEWILIVNVLQSYCQEEIHKNIANKILRGRFLSGETKALLLYELEVCKVGKDCNGLCEKMRSKERYISL